MNEPIKHELGIRVLAVGPWFDSQEYRKVTAAACGRLRTSFEEMMLGTDWPATVQQMGRDHVKDSLDQIEQDLNRRIVSARESLRSVEKRATFAVEKRRASALAYATVDDDDLGRELHAARAKLRLFQIRLNHVKAFRIEDLKL